MSFSIADDYAALGEDLLPFVLPDGPYVLRVIKAESGLTGNQKPKIVLTFEVAEGAHMGRTFTTQVIWSSGGNPVAARISASSFTVLGAPYAWIRGARPSDDEIAEAMVGNVIQAKVKSSEFGGMIRNEIGNYTKTVSLNNPKAIAAQAFAAQAVAGAGVGAAGVTLPPNVVAAGVTLGQAPQAQAPAQAPAAQQVDPWANPQAAAAAAQAAQAAQSAMIAQHPAAGQAVGLPGGWPSA